MHIKDIISAGKKLATSGKALIMLHGRGGSAEDILSLSEYLDIEKYSLFAPQATNNSWYPFSFLAPPDQNQPWLSSALANIKDLVEDIKMQQISSEQIYFLGFSQGACLTLEFVARNAEKWGGVVAFTGGLIGDRIYPENYSGDFFQTPIFIGTSDPDPHIPVSRVEATTSLLRKMNADVTEVIYKNMGHTISGDEIKKANEIVFTRK